MKNIHIGCKFISILIILVLFLNWKNVTVPLQLASQQPGITVWTVFLSAIGILFLLLNAMAAIGMYLTKWWGFIATYAAVIFSTIFFSTSYVPLIGELFPEQGRFISLVVINLLVFAYTAYLNLASRKK